MTDDATAPRPPIATVPTHADVVAAARRLAGIAHRTPVITSRTLDAEVGAQVFLKAESLQRVGAFKFRGAYNAVAALSAEARERGVVAWSSGNHAQAVALAAQLLHVHATIVMPTDAPPNKVAATLGYGAEVVTYDRYTQGREEIGQAIADERGATVIPPFDHPDVIAGQGTAAAELVDEVGDLDALFVPIGGGGLAAGSALVLGNQAAPGRIVAVEPDGRVAARRALSEGRPVAVEVPRTLMDGQQTRYVGHLTTAILSAAGAEAIGVSDTDVVAAMRFLAERCKLVVEPSGAAGLAGLRSAAPGIDGARVGVVLSGGNVDLARLGELLATAR